MFSIVQETLHLSAQRYASYEGSQSAVTGQLGKYEY